MRWWLLLIALVGCWPERVTGEDVPLDPAFYEAVEQAQGQPGVGGGSAVPFSSYDGDTVVVSGVVTGGDPALAVDIDVRVPDPTAAGGVEGMGKLLLEEPGPFELVVPKSLGALQLQAFQDKSADGPSADDPFAEIDVEIGDGDIGNVAMAMVEGARSGGGAGPEHVEMPPGGSPEEPPSGEQSPAAPGAPGGEPQAGGDGGPGGAGGDPFAGVEGPRVTLSGRLVWTGGGTIDLDLFRPDDRSSGGRRPLGKLKRSPGPFEISVPSGYGALVLEAFIDLDNNGPGLGDPRGCYPGGALNVGTHDLKDLVIELSVAADGKADSCGAPAPKGQPGAPPRPR